LPERRPEEGRARPMSDSLRRERAFQLPWLELAAVEWGEPGGIPVIALHGWLDNAGTFDLLAPLLEGCHVIALDSAGHGHSRNRSPDAGYNIWQDVRDVVGVADALDWPQFKLLGHSRGAAIATLVAGAFPERVSGLGLIEGGVPIPGKAAESPQALARAIREQAALHHREGRVFETRERAILERSRGFTEVTVEAAEVLARRSLREVDGGYRWHFDQRLKAQSEIRLTPDQISAFVGRITAAATVFFASVSPFTTRPEFRALITQIPQLAIVELEGGHHFHLEGAERAIAERLLASWRDMAP
jgi:pimeloyl-ACP methyl ester carboxylesterase